MTQNQSYIPLHPYTNKSKQKNIKNLSKYKPLKIMKITKKWIQCLRRSFFKVMTMMTSATAESSPSPVILANFFLARKALETALKNQFQ